MGLGDPTTAERAERSALDVALETLDNALTGLIDTVESGGLEHLTAAEKISFWQQFETFRNRLPLIDHSLIAGAEASDLAAEYNFTNLTRFLMRMFLLSHGEAAARVRAAAAVGPRSSMLGERLQPLLPKLAAVQRHGAVTVEQVQIVERAMHKLSRIGLNPAEVETAEKLLTDYAPVLGPADLHRYALRVVDAADPDGPEPVDDQLQQDRRYLDLKQRRDGMWHLQGRLTSTVGAQLNAILDPLARHRTSSIEDEDGNTTQIPDDRPFGQRLHDGLDEASARLLKTKDQPLVGGIPASVIITVQLEDLLSKAGLAETNDGTILTCEQLLRIADEAEIWPTIVNRNNVPLALGRTQRLASRGQTMALIARDAGCSFPGCTHPPSYCDRHHIKDWILGGATDLDNLTLL
ncbi:MAG TPA: DUF222 domain-containing protein, partial [Propionibacteriaceae bacterium]|nr:DUF222 domain-containing protein [Propionibacteriaceae bacterium]